MVVMKTFFLLAIMAFACGCGASKTATTATPAPAGPITEDRLGLKIYPAATIVTSGETDEVVSANLRTPDSADKVIAFYEAELGAKGSGDPAAYTISADKKGRKFAISINTDQGATNVSIMGKK
jgi:hypothetical protein